MSDMSTDSDDTSLTDWSIVDKDGHMDDSDSLSTASSTEVLEEDEEEDESATPIHHRNSIGVGPCFILRLSSRESAKREPKSEGDATPIISAAADSIEVCSKLSSDIRELQENPNAKNNEMDSPILRCTDGEGQGGMETVDFIETAAIESIGSLNERQIHSPDFLALDDKTLPKTGDEVKPLIRMMLETEPQTETQLPTEDMTGAHREIRTECVNKTEIGLQTETKNKTSIRLNKLSKFTKKIWSWLQGYLNDGFAASIRNHLLHFLLFVMILILGIIIGFVVASKQLKVHEEQEISPSVKHNDLQKCQEMEKETEKNKLTSIPPSDMQSNSDGKAFGKLELQKEEKPDLVSQPEYDDLVADRPCPILVKERYSPEEQDHAERGACYRQIHKVESQSSHVEMENTKSEPLFQDLVQPDGVKSHKAFIDTDFPKSQIAAVKEHSEKNETNNAHGSDENVNVIVEKLGNNDVIEVDTLDTEVDEYEMEDSTDEEENHDNFNFDDIDYDHEDDNVDDEDDNVDDDDDNVDDDDDIDPDHHDDDDDNEAYVDEEGSFDSYGTTYNYKPDSSKAHVDANRDGVEGHQTGMKFDDDHKSGFDSSDSNSLDPKQVKPKLETGPRQEEGNTRYDKRDNSKEATGERENKWMNTVLDMWNKTRASVTNVTNQIKETWQQVKNLSVDLWEKNQPYVEKLQQQIGSTVEKASQSLRKKFQKATQKIQKVTRRWFRSKDSDADVAEDDSYQEDIVHSGHAKTSRRHFQEEVTKDGGPKTVKQEIKRDQVDQLPLKNARKQKLDVNHFDKMEKGTPQHNHDTKFEKGYGDCQRGRRHDTAKEHCGGHSKHAEKKFKRSCKKNVYILFRDVNKVNRIDLSRSINLNAGDQIFDSFSKFKDQFGLDVLTDEIRTWFMCQSDFWDIWREWYNGGHYHSSLQGITDVKCMQYLKCWQIKEMDPAYFRAQKCQKGDFRSKMKKLLKNPCVDYQPGEYGRTVNPTWESKPIEKPQMPHPVKNDDFSENKKKKKQADLQVVRNLQRGNKHKDVSDSMDDKKKNIEGDWYLQLASEREHSRTKADYWYLRRLERSHGNLDGEHNVKQESAWLFERAAKRQNLRVFK